MKLLSLRMQGRFHNAVMVGGDVLDLVAARPVIPLAACLPDRMAALLATGQDGLGIVARIIDAALPQADRLRAIGALLPFADAPLAPVVPDPDLVLSGSMNSRDHIREMGDTELPEHPCAFLKVRSALAASGDAIRPPPACPDMIDWEGEFAVVIGRRCHQVDVQHAMEHVAGYTLMNDLSARDYAMPFITAKGASKTAQAWERNVLGKNYPGFSPIGPVILTKDEVPLPFDYRMQTIVNGQVMQSSTPDDLVFQPDAMVAYFSNFYVLQPGDIISMGSPPGVGMMRKPPQFLRPGDVVEVRVPEIGALVNVVAHAPNGPA